MTYISLKVFTISLICFQLGINGEVTYTAEFAEDLKSCPDFYNEHMELNLKLGLVDDKDDASIGLNGDMIINHSIEEGYQVNVEIWKILDVGKEFTFAMEGDICSNLKKEDAPWYPLAISLNRTECPIPARTYTVSDLIISLDFANDLLTHEFVGDYEVYISIVDGEKNPFSCYLMYISVIEKYE